MSVPTLTLADAALQAVREMHFDYENRCGECLQAWPCNTVEVMNGILSGKIDWANQEADVEAQFATPAFVCEAERSGDANGSWRRHVDGGAGHR